MFWPYGISKTGFVSFTRIWIESMCMGCCLESEDKIMLFFSIITS